MPLNPQVARYLQAQAALGPPLRTAPAMRQRRSAQSLMGIEDRTIDSGDGGIAPRIYSPPGLRPLPVLVYYHGGGWVTGDLDGSDFQCRLLSR